MGYSHASVAGISDGRANIKASRLRARAVGGKDGPGFIRRAEVLRASICALLGALCAISVAAAAGDENLPGGPLAGIKLPLMKTQHGEPEGHPGLTILP